MSEEERFLRQCNLKKQYPNYGMARRAAATMTIRENIGRLEPYFCDFCKQYHIGHPRGKNHERTGR